MFHVLQPVAQLYEQVHMLWNQHIVRLIAHWAILLGKNCSHVHTAFVCITWLNSHTLCWMRFSVCFSMCAVTTSHNLAWAPFFEQCSEQVVVWLANRLFSTISLSLHCGNDKLPIVLMVGKCCCYALLTLWRLVGFGDSHVKTTRSHVALHT